MKICVKLCFDLSLDLAIMPTPWAAFLEEVGKQLIRHAKVMIFLDPEIP
jgi:hypothetical protein